MDRPLENAQEVKRLQRCLNDLVSLLALPAIWVGNDSSQIAQTLLDALFGMLRLDFVYVRLNDPDGGPPHELVRSAQSGEPPVGASAIGASLDQSLGAGAAHWPANAHVRIDETDLFIAAVRLGLHGELGVVVAGAQRSDFPQQNERLLLQVAANQTAIALQESRRLDEQKRIARELDERVALRTRELVAANEELREEIAERRRVEAALRESEQRSQLVVDTIPGLVAIMTPSGEIDTVNAQVLEYCGGNLQDLRRWENNGTIHPSDLSNVTRLLADATASGDPYDFEARIRRHDGVYRWFQVRGLPLRDATNHILRWYVLLTDIDERKCAEEVIRQSEARLAQAERELRLTLDSIPAIIVRGATNGYIEYLNKQWFEYTGSTLETARGFRWQESLHPDDKDRLVEFGARFVATAEPGDCEARLRRFDGVYRWFLFRPAPARDEAGKFVGWYGTVTDIEDRKRAEEKVAEAERELRRAIDGIPAMVTAFRADGSLLFINKRSTDFVGPANAGDIAITVHPDDLERSERKWRECIASGEPFDLEMRTRRADGKYRWLKRLRLPLRDEAGNIIRWYGVGYDIEDQKQAEASLVKAERELRRTLDSIPTMTWQAAPNGYVQKINKQFFDYTGAAPDEVKGNRWQSCVHPDDLPGLLAIGNANVPAERPLEAEARLRRFDGAYRWFLFRLAPSRDETGKVVGWYGTIADIEDRKRIETQLAGEKHLLEMVASGRPLLDVLSVLCKFVEEAAPDCYCDVHLIDWSSQTFQFGVAPSLPASYTAPIAGSPVRDDLVPCGIAAHQKIQVIAEDIESDARWCTSPVRTHVLDHGLRSVWSTPILSKDGSVLGTLCIYQREPANPSPYHQDLIAHATHLASIAIERSRAEAALKRSETFLAEGQRISLTGSFSWRVDTDEMKFSDELHRIFELEPHAVVTFGLIGERIHPEDLPILAEKQAQIRAGIDNPQYEIRLRMPDGRVKYTRVFGRVIRHENDRLECLGAVQDVTERRLAEEALDKARSELAHVTRVMSLGALTASIAHEVNQPLAGIITNAGTCLRMLGADPPNVEGARETARRTIRDGNRAADVIARLRALFSKKGAATEIVDLSEATREVLALVSGDLWRSKVILRAELGDDRPLLVTGDRVQLQQVILNLVRNATDAMSGLSDRPRDLLVRTEMDEDGQARLIVRDAGVGFTPEESERLFDAFYTTKGDGLGIGLSLSRSIIESHGGELWAEANDTHGATFSFFIPLRSARAADERAASDAVWTSDARGERGGVRNA